MPNGGKGHIAVIRSGADNGSNHTDADTQKAGVIFRVRP